MRQNHFTRPTILAALAMLEARLSQAKFDQLALRLAQEKHISSDTSISVPKKAARLGRLILTNGTEQVQTLDGTVTLAEAAVREAIALMVNLDNSRPEQERLMRALALDRSVVYWKDESSSSPLMRAALPEEVDLPATDDEVHQLLEHFGFNTARGHLDQVIEAHTRGDWAAQMAKRAHSLRVCSRKSPTTSTRLRPRPREAPRTVALGRHTADSCPSLATIGRTMARATSTGSSKCCIRKAPTLGCPLRTAVPFACTWL